MSEQGEKTAPNEKRTRRGWVWLLAGIVVALLALAADLASHLGPELLSGRNREPALQLPSPIDLAALPTVTRFDFPLGTEHGAMAYNAQPFTRNNHLGDDLNGIGGKNSDLGDPVFAVADGLVLAAQKGGPGWGNVILVLHAYRENGTRKYIQSFYGHVQDILVAPHEQVRRGEQIATVGTGDGKYFAHLHFEMREFSTPYIGAGYRQDTRGWLDPSLFIRTHRGAPDEDVGRTQE